MRARTFRRHGEHVRATFDALDVELLADTRDQLRSLLDRADAADPVVQRLFPTAVLGDETVDREVRGLLHEDLLQRRLDGLDALAAILERGEPHHGGVQVDLTDDEPQLVLAVLNDVRLAIGASIDIDSVDRAAALHDDALAYRLAVMDHFAGFQEELLHILDPAALSYTDEVEPEEPG